MVLSEEQRKAAAVVPEHGTAVITITHRFNSRQQHTFHQYYSKHFGPENIYVGIHMHGTCEIGQECDAMQAERRFHLTPTMLKMASRGSKLVATHCGQGHSMGATQISVGNDLSTLLREYGYTNIIFAEDDEFLVPDPVKFPGGLLEYVSKFSAEVTSDASQKPWRRAHGFNVWQADDEQEIDRSRSVLQQRKFWRGSDPYYCKTLLTHTAGGYGSGGHSWEAKDQALLQNFGAEKVDSCNDKAESDLLLIHLKCVDRKQFKDQVFREHAIEHRVANINLQSFKMDAHSKEYSKEFDEFFEPIW
eukprot:gene26399-32383_t